jgi:hypothetical protein
MDQLYTIFIKVCSTSTRRVDFRGKLESRGIAKQAHPPTINFRYFLPGLANATASSA